MPILEEPVNSLGAFIDRVNEIRKSWGLPKHKELWFRGDPTRLLDWSDGALMALH
jgi:hypothetical protein